MFNLNFSCDICKEYLKKLESPIRNSEYFHFKDTNHDFYL